MWSRLGADLRLNTSARMGSLMDTHGARMAMTLKTTRMPSPMSARRWRRNRGQTPREDLRGMADAPRVASLVSLTVDISLGPLRAVGRTAHVSRTRGSA